jgi:Flp pilus assembly pilin Flp
MKALEKTTPDTGKARGLLRDQRGITTVEYVVIMVLVALGSILLWTKFKDSIGTRVGNAGTQIEGLQ